MDYGICLLSVIPVRKTGSHQSEIVTQMVFGELCYIENKFESWLNIRTFLDDYSGWIHVSQIKQISENTFNSLANAKLYLVNKPFTTISEKKDNSFLITIGSQLYGFANEKFIIEDLEFHLDKQDVISFQKRTIEDLLATAKTFLKTPYLWGGKTIMGIDCSGFSQLVFRLNGINIPRDAYQQAELGQNIMLISEAQSGDLIFFDNADGNIVHVGIYIGNNEIIHASGEVRIDNVDHQGIFNKTINQYSHKLRLIKRIC